jgi:hypothetical protein
MTQSDKRIARSTAAASRSSRGAADESRTESDGTAFTMAERRAMIRSEFQQEALPRAPLIPGFHTCWLSTTNSYDPISKRIRIGYIPVRADEVPGMEAFDPKAGEHAGFISCNEMLLFKIDLDQYQAIMEEFHHHLPMEQEEALKDGLIRQEQDRAGKSLTQLEDGAYQDIAVKKNPVFAV